MACRKAMGNHVFLRKAPLSSQFANSFSKAKEEYTLICNCRHAAWPRCLWASSRAPHSSASCTLQTKGDQSIALRQYLISNTTSALLGLLMIVRATIPLPGGNWWAQMTLRKSFSGERNRIFLWRLPIAPVLCHSLTMRLVV